MAVKLIKKGATIKPTPKPVTIGGGGVKKAVAAKVASRPTVEVDARTAWKKLWGG